jgi:hypothetical protein
MFKVDNVFEYIGSSILFSSFIDNEAYQRRNNY